MILSQEEIEKRIADSYELPNNVIESNPEPMVTVRTSTYQHGAYIKECIEGVLMQKTSFPIEYIIGEDFSTDGTREIVFDYAKKYPDIIRVITADYNVGMEANGIRCMRKSRGKYMALCEGDDYWTDPLKLQKQVDFLETNPEFVASFHSIKIRNEGNVKWQMKDRTAISPFVGDFHTAVQGFYGKTGTLSVVFKKDAINLDMLKSVSKSVGVGDWPLFLLLSLKGKAYSFPEVMGVYRNHSGGVTKINDRNKMFYNTRIKVLQRLIPIIEDKQKQDYCREFLFRIYIHKIEWLMVTGNWHLLKSALKDVLNYKKPKKVRPPIPWLPGYKLTRIALKMPLTVLLGFKNLITGNHLIK